MTSSLNLRVVHFRATIDYLAFVETFSYGLIRMCYEMNVGLSSHAHVNANEANFVKGQLAALTLYFYSLNTAYMFFFSTLFLVNGSVQIQTWLCNTPFRRNVDHVTQPSTCFTPYCSTYRIARPCEVLCPPIRNC